MQEADMATTNMAEQQGRYNGDETLLVKFYRHSKLDQPATKLAGRPIYSEHDYISIMQPGNKDSIIIRPAMEMDKTRFAQHWAKYQARETQPEMIGTPLEEWGGLNSAQVNELKYMNVRTVEQLLAMTDTNSQGMMGVSMLKSRAKRFLDGAESDKLAAENAEQKELLKSMAARLEELEKGAKKKPAGGKKSAQTVPDIEE